MKNDINVQKILLEFKEYDWSTKIIMWKHD